MSFNDFGPGQPVKKTKKIKNISDVIIPRFDANDPVVDRQFIFLMSPKTVASLFEKDRAENEFENSIDLWMLEVRTAIKFRSNHFKCKNGMLGEIEKVSLFASAIYGK